MSDIDLSEVVTDDSLADSYDIIRSTGHFGIGGWTTQSTTVASFGVVSVANREDLDMLAAGDRLTGVMVFHSADRIYATQKDNNPDGSQTQRVSDIIVWENDQWRIIHVASYPNRGYWKAFGVRMQGN